jgi:hypothetical protein
MIGYLLTNTESVTGRVEYRKYTLTRVYNISHSQPSSKNNTNPTDPASLGIGRGFPKYTIPSIINEERHTPKAPTKAINPPTSETQPMKSTERKATDSNCQTPTQQLETQQPYSAKTGSAHEHDNVSSRCYHPDST